MILDELSLYLLTDENTIINEAIEMLEKQFNKHYVNFRNRLIAGGFMFVIGIVFLSASPLLSAILILMGIILILLALTNKVHIREIDTVLYPVVAVPYGDGSLSLVIDLLSEAGDEITFNVPRIDLLSDDLNYSLIKLRSLINQFKDFEGQQESLIKLQRVGDEGFMMTSLEVLMRNEMSELLKILKNRPYDSFSFKLFKISDGFSIHPIELIKPESLIVKDLSKLANNIVSEVNSLLKSLEVQYSHLLEDVRAGIGDSRDFMNSYYDGLNELSETTYKFLLYIMKRAQVRVCPRCFVSMRNDILLSSSYPLLMKSFGMDEEGNVRYVCPRCGSMYLENVHLVEGDQEPIKMYWFETLQSRSWSRLYVSRLDEINRYISEARRLKEEKYSELMHHVNTLMHQSRSYLLPIYMELNKLYNELRANNDVLGYISALFPTSLKLCERTEVSDRVINTEESTKMFLSGKEVYVDLAEKLSNVRKLKVDFVYLNEVAIEKLIEAHEKLGKSEISNEIRRIISEKDFEEFENYLKEPFHEV